MACADGRMVGEGRCVKLVGYVSHAECAGAETVTCGFAASAFIDTGDVCRDRTPAGCRDEAAWEPFDEWKERVATMISAARR